MSVWFKCDACGHYESRTPGLGGLGSVSGACPVCGGASRYAPEGPPPDVASTPVPDAAEAAPTVLLSKRDGKWQQLSNVPLPQEEPLMAPTVLVSRPSIVEAQRQQASPAPAQHAATSPDPAGDAGGATQTVARGHSATLAMSPQDALREAGRARAQQRHATQPSRPHDDHATVEDPFHNARPSFDSAQHPSFAPSGPAPSGPVAATVEAPRPSLGAPATHDAHHGAQTQERPVYAQAAEPQWQAPRPLSAPVVSRAIPAPTPSLRQDPPTAAPPVEDTKGKQRGVFARPSTAMLDSIAAREQGLPIGAEAARASRPWLPWAIGVTVVALLAAAAVALLG